LFIGNFQAAGEDTRTKRKARQSRAFPIRRSSKTYWNSFEAENTTW
jgi:hypothetical protein